MNSIMIRHQPEPSMTIVIVSGSDTPYLENVSPISMNPCRREGSLFAARPKNLTHT